jgi:anthranilate/para-aminobenzoate synthase component II
MADLYGLNDFLHTTEIPVYAACGGHQLVGFCFNVDLRKAKELFDQPMRKLRPGETDQGPYSHPGYYVATGYQEVEIVQRDPIWKGLRGKFRVLEAHYCEVKKLPPGFDLLATSPECRLEMMKHRELPIYGAQFHAENWVEPYFDGRTIMENFFRIAGLIA